ncbi:hypothetical protein [Microbulbifer taiwanensis]|uniref:Uncharacterized protein n=1 Tax=Microbulbifer taiwanensis TaxID=986746 RepID=A0ABW1YHN6_9GAMM|nr:hypothetical protein [Microbulbifer taiwanensis]
MSKIVWLYELVYYRMYRWSERVEGGRSDTHISAAIILSFVLVQNVLLICFLLLFTGLSELDWLATLNKWVGFFIVVGICVVNIVLFERNGRYVSVVEKFCNDDDKSLVRDRVVDVVVIGSFVVTMLVIVLMAITTK